MSDEVMYDSKEDCYMVPEELFEEMEKAVTELSSIKSRLPVNADGDVIQFRSIQYGMRNGNMRAITVMRIDAFGENEFLMLDENDFDFEAHELFSTAESCRAANGKGE